MSIVTHRSIARMRRFFFMVFTVLSVCLIPVSLTII